MAVGWICMSCGEEFDVDPGHCHPAHDDRCDGGCEDCPVQCGPIEMIVPPGERP